MRVLLRLLWLGLVFIATAAPVMAQRAGLTLQPTSACVQLEAHTSCAAMPAQLPFRWDERWSAIDGSARFDFEFDLSPADTDGPWLLLPRAGNGFTVTLNGKSIFAIGGPGTQRHDATKRPWLVPLPEHLLAAHNRLAMTVYATQGRAAQLQAPRLGTRAVMQAEYERLYLWRVEITRALMWMSLVLGLIAMLFGLALHEKLFVACGLAELAWAVRLSEVFWIDMPLDWQLWGAGVATVFAVTQLAMAYFFLQAVGRWNRFFRRAYAVYAGLWCLVVPLMVLLRWRDLWVGWLLGVTMMFLLLAVYVGVTAFRERQFWRWLFAAWVFCSVLAGVADLIESAGSMYSHPTWSRFVMAFFSLAMMALVARRLQLSRVAELQHRDALLRALQQQKRELEVLHAASSRGTLERAMLDERQRVMRDMHDGLGAQLSGLMLMAGRPETLPQQLQVQVRSAIDELRLVVDAMAPFDGNLSTLLGNLRPQLEQRLALSHIGLRWAVDDLPPAGGFTPERLQHLRRLLLEAATNVARHSGASEAVFSASVSEAQLRLSMADNGRGFDANGPAAGNGLRNMRWRAQELGGELSFSTAPSGCVTLLLPLIDAGLVAA